MLSELIMRYSILVPRGSLGLIIACRERLSFNVKHRARVYNSIALITDVAISRPSLASFPIALAMLGISKVKGPKPFLERETVRGRIPLLL